MPHNLAIDRFEGDAKEIAVLVDEQDRTILIPRDLLAKNAREGDILVATFQVDAEATARVQAEARALDSELSETDPGGDLKI